MLTVSVSGEFERLDWADRHAASVVHDQKKVGASGLKLRTMIYRLMQCDGLSDHARLTNQRADDMGVGSVRQRQISSLHANH